MNKKTTVFAIGRWMPLHLGHKHFLVKLARTYDRIVIGIGSCYENGTVRNCIPAVEREKLLRKIFKTEGITNFVIIPVQDRPTFKEWISDVCRVCEKYNVTHFCTGNKEDILDVMDDMGIKLDMEMINPENDSDFPYHATDIREAIAKGDNQRVSMMIPTEIKSIVLKQIATEIIASLRGEGREFIPGRQTADLIFLVKDSIRNKYYVLVGKRNMTKTDFPGVWAIPGGGIKEFESAIDAAARCFLSETGIDIQITDNSEEPAMVRISNLDIDEAKLHFLNIYASHDERINGTLGGASQCFALCIEGKIDDINKVLKSTHDMDELRFVDVDDVQSLVLAYDQKRMLVDALGRLDIPFNNGEMLEVIDAEGNCTGESVSRIKAHSEGILHGASHIFICKKEAGELYVLLQRRSLQKDSFPGCLDISSAGHVERGYDFISTAQKELSEELGIKALPTDLIELFTQTIDVEYEFRGKRFVDREFNRIYLLRGVPDITEIIIQPEELSEVFWMKAHDVIKHLDMNDIEFGMNAEEFKKAISIIEKHHLFNC